MIEYLHVEDELLFLLLGFSMATELGKIIYMVAYLNVWNIKLGGVMEASIKVSKTHWNPIKQSWNSWLESPEGHYIK